MISYYYLLENLQLLLHIHFQEEKSNLNSSQKQNNKFIQNSSERLLKIFISRLIGVEGIMAVSSNNNLSFNLFFSALNEKFIRGENSFYDKFKNEKRTTSKCSNKNGLKNDCIINSISLMGIVAFLFYTGSFIFLFFALIFICLICSLLEILAYKLSNNMVFASFIAQVLAYRLWHFGYIPSNMSIFKGINQLPPGFLLGIKSSKNSFMQWMTVSPFSKSKHFYFKI